MSSIIIGFAAQNGTPEHAAAGWPAGHVPDLVVATSRDAAVVIARATDARPGSVLVVTTPTTPIARLLEVAIGLERAGVRVDYELVDVRAPILRQRQAIIPPTRSATSAGA